jgi:predicted transcriptional regulator
MIGFDVKDSKILTTLSRKPLSVPDLVKRTGFNRMTVTRRLTRLANLHMVQRRQVAQRTYVWRRSTSMQQGRGIVTMYQGADVARARTLLKRLPKRSVVYGLLGSAAHETEAKRYGLYRTGDTHEAFRRRGILVRTLAGTGIETVTARFVHDHHEHLPPLRVSQDIKITTRVSFQSSCVYSITRRFILMVDEKQRIAIVIRHEKLASMLHDTMSMLFGVIDSIENTTPIDLGAITNHILNHYAQKSKKPAPAHRSTS